MPTYFTNDASTPNTVAYAYTTGYANNPITSNVLINLLTYKQNTLTSNTNLLGIGGSISDGIAISVIGSSLQAQITALQAEIFGLDAGVITTEANFGTLSSVMATLQSRLASLQQSLASIFTRGDELQLDQLSSLLNADGSANEDAQMLEIYFNEQGGGRYSL